MSRTSAARDMGPAGFPTGTRVRHARGGFRGMRIVLAVGGLAFLAVNVAIGVVIVSGALDGQWYDFRDLGIAVQQLREGLDDRFDPWVSYVVTAAIGGGALLTFIGVMLVLLVWVERRLLARFQVRRGPNRVGPFGLLQPVADALKLIQKEVLVPQGADRLMFFLPPILVFIPLMLIWGPVPWARHMSFVDLNVGVLYVIAAGSLTTLVIFIAGWSSNNHYALLGSMRTVAMMISYEIPQSMSLVAVVIMAGSMNLGEIVEWQSDHNLWLAALLPISLFSFFFSSTAELNRTPNDIAEAESEIVAGFHTEYSGMKFGLFLAVELGNTLAVSALVATLFLGGWSLFGLEEWIPGYLILAAKISAMYFLFVWLRATLPRFRLDQLMAFAWKYLIPLSIVNVLIAAAEATIFAEVETPGIVLLGAFVVVNWVLAVVLFRLWAGVAGHRPEREHLLRPTLATSVGGLEAAKRMQQVASSPAASSR